MSGTQSPATDVRAPSQTRPRPKSRGPLAVVDVGSNSVRLVIYEAESRAAATIHNEKSICGIGRDMVTTGRLHSEGCAMALEALARFKMLADGLHATVREAVATAAARDATNGAEFVRRAEAAWGAARRPRARRWGAFPEKKMRGALPQAASSPAPPPTRASPITAAAVST